MITNVEQYWTQYPQLAMLSSGSLRASWLPVILLSSIWDVIRQLSPGGRHARANSQTLCRRPFISDPRPGPEQNRVANARPRTQPANSIRIAGPSNLCAAFCLFTA